MEIVRRANQEDRKDWERALLFEAYRSNSRDSTAGSVLPGLTQTDIALAVPARKSYLKRRKKPDLSEAANKRL